jgi:hypothetical protein
MKFQVDVYCDSLILRFAINRATCRNKPCMKCLRTAGKKQKTGYGNSKAATELEEHLQLKKLEIFLKEAMTAALIATTALPIG